MFFSFCTIQYLYIYLGKCILLFLFFSLENQIQGMTHNWASALAQSHFPGHIWLFCLFRDGVAQDGLELLGSSEPPAAASQEPEPDSQLSIR